MIKLIAETSFNYDADDKEFGIQDRIVRVYEDKGALTLCFELGRKEDDTINLTFETEELTLKIARARAEEE